MNVTVVLLDGGQFQVENLRKDTLGKEIFKNACNKIGLTDETDYFGLRFVNKKDAEFQWLDNERSIKSQLGKEVNDNVTHFLHFAVKFFPVNPTNIKNDLTRYQFVLQLRESLLNGRLECSTPIYALLGSFIAQAEFGDYDSPDISENYLEGFKVCPDQPNELLEKIRDYHKRHKNMTPEQAELNFLDHVRKLPMYGIHRHLALDVNCEKVFIGVSNIGVTVYRGNRLMSTFVWPQILSIGFKSKTFYIKIKPADEDDDVCKTSVGFKLSDRVAAKRLWRICVEHHTFFRLENVGLAEKKGWLSRFGSRFSYRGKTENEILKEDPKPTEEPFIRVSSKRFSERVLKGNRKQPQDMKNEGQDTPRILTKSEQEIPPAVPAIELSSEATVASASNVEGVASTSEVTGGNGGENVPEIKVVHPSPEMKTKWKEEEGDGDDEVETPNERTEEKVEETEDKEEENKQNEPVATDDTPEQIIVISNPLAGDEVKSFTSESITTTISTTQSSDISADDTVSSSTLISSTQQVTTQTTQQVVTTTTTSETVVQTTEEDVDVGLV